MNGHVVVTRNIAAPADSLWRMVADLPRMPEWSPENVRADWLAGATQPTVGARFRSANRNGSKTWKSAGEITECEPGRLLAFRIKAGPFEISKWTYTFESTPGGCRVTETWTDQRSRLMKAVSKRVTGVDDRSAHNRRGMQQTLANLAAAAERPAPSTDAKPGH